MPRGRKPDSPEKRLEIAKRLRILVDPDDEWVLTAFSWHKISGCQHLSARIGEGQYSSIMQVIMGPSPPGRNYRRHDARGHDYRRKNIYLPEPYYLSPANTRKKEAALAKRNQDISAKRIAALLCSPILANARNRGRDGNTT
jgi:hypothetical protein